MLKIFSRMNSTLKKKNKIAVNINTMAGPVAIRSPWKQSTKNSALPTLHTTKIQKERSK